MPIKTIAQVAISVVICAVVMVSIVYELLSASYSVYHQQSDTAISSVPPNDTSASAETVGDFADASGSEAIWADDEDDNRAAPAVEVEAEGLEPAALMADAITSVKAGSEKAAMDGVSTQDTAIQGTVLDLMLSAGSPVSDAGSPVADETTSTAVKPTLQHLQQQHREALNQLTVERLMQGGGGMETGLTPEWAPIPDTETTADSETDLEALNTPVLAQPPMTESAGLISSLATDETLLVNQVFLAGDLFYPQYQLDQAFADQALERALDQQRLSLPDELTIDQLYDLAHDISVAYREQGMAFNTVSLQAQKISQGNVELYVENGRLGEINIFNNQHYTTEQLLAPLKPYLNKPLYAPNIKQAMGEIKSMPGLRIFSYYSRGATPGEVRLNMKVMEENTVDYLFDLDNYGIEETGKIRFSYSQVNNNLLGVAGQNNLIVTMSETAESLLGVWQYRLPARTLRGHVGFQVARSDYEVGGDFAELGLEGNILSSSLFYQPWYFGDGIEGGWGHHFFKRMHRIGLSVNRSEVGSRFESFQLLNDTTRYLKLMLTPRTLWDKQFEHWRARLNLEVALGHVNETDEAKVDDSFSLWTITSQFQRPLAYDLQRPLSWKSLSLNTTIQYSNAILPSAETFTTTGLYGVRGYVSGLFNPHSGILSTLALNGPPRVFEGAQWLDLRYSTSLFIDLSYGIDNLLAESLIGSESKSGFLGAGGMITAQLYRDFIINAQLAAPLTETGYVTLGSEDDSDWQFYFSIKYRL